MPINILYHLYIFFSVWQLLVQKMFLHLGLQFQKIAALRSHRILWTFCWLNVSNATFISFCEHWYLILYLFVLCELTDVYFRRWYEALFFLVNAEMAQAWEFRYYCVIVNSTLSNPHLTKDLFLLRFSLG